MVAQFLRKASKEKPKNVAADDALALLALATTVQPESESPSLLPNTPPSSVPSPPPGSLPSVPLLSRSPSPASYEGSYSAYSAYSNTDGISTSISILSSFVKKTSTKTKSASVNNNTNLYLLLPRHRPYSKGLTFASIKQLQVYVSKLEIWNALEGNTGSTGTTPRANTEDKCDSEPEVLLILLNKKDQNPAPELKNDSSEPEDKNGEVVKEEYNPKDKKTWTIAKLRSQCDVRGLKKNGDKSMLTEWLRCALYRQPKANDHTATTTGVTNKNDFFQHD